MGRRYRGRATDGVWPSRIEHAVEHGDADDGFSALRGLATSAQPRADDPLVAAVDAHSGQIVAVALTDQDVDDASQVGPLLEQIEPPLEQITAGGAYDGEPTYQKIGTTPRLGEAAT